MSAMGTFTALLGGLALGAVGFELASQGDLGPGGKALAGDIAHWFGAATGSGTGSGSGKPGSYVSMTGTGATDTVVVICSDGTQRSDTWATVDSNLKAAGYGGALDHSAAEATAYAQACKGAG